jgi:putative FmdB family regulatory protein
MPVYTFRCRKCQEDVEIEHKASEPHPKKHKGCGGALRRTFSTPEIVYKGSGFYHTDKRLDKPAN